MLTDRVSSKHASITLITTYLKIFLPGLPYIWVAGAGAAAPRLRGLRGAGAARARGGARGAAGGAQRGARGHDLALLGRRGPSRYTLADVSPKVCETSPERSRV